MPDCDHCGLDLGGEPVVDAGVEGRFCCRGCLEVSGFVAEIDADVPARRTGAPDVPDGEFERDGRTVSGVVDDVGVTVDHPDELAIDGVTDSRARRVLPQESAHRSREYRTARTPSKAISATIAVAAQRSPVRWAITASCGWSP